VGLEDKALRQKYYPKGGDFCPNPEGMAFSDEEV